MVRGGARAGADEQHVDDLLTSKILAGELPAGRRVTVSASDGTVRITR